MDSRPVGGEARRSAGDTRGGRRRSRHSQRPGVCHCGLRPRPLGRHDAAAARVVRRHHLLREMAAARGRRQSHEARGEEEPDGGRPRLRFQCSLALLLKPMDQERADRVKTAFAAAFTHPVDEVRLYATAGIDENAWTADRALALRCLERDRDRGGRPRRSAERPSRAALRGAR